MNFSDGCPKPQNWKHPKGDSFLWLSWETALCSHSPTLLSRRSSALCRPTEKSASVRGGMCMLFRVCFSSLGDPGETPALQPTLTFADRVYEWLKIGGVVSPTPVLEVSPGHTEVRCAKCFGFVQCHLCYYITTMASVVKVTGKLSGSLCIRRVLE